MSANLDLVRSIHVAWERGDFSSTEWAHPEIEFVIADGPAPSSRTGVGKTSGLDLRDVRTKGANLFHVRDGKVTKLVIYFDRERALADLGLASEAGSPDS
jgi:ketosteroid isomerase-like protein